MLTNLTRLSAAEYDHIIYGHMTPAMAAAYLREERIPLRSFSEVLRGMYPASDLLPRLADYFLLTETDANAQSLAVRPESAGESGGLLPHRLCPGPQ